MLKRVNRDVSEGSLKSGGMILSVTLRSLYELVSHLCLTGLPEVAMPYSDMWQDCQRTFPHTKSSCRSVDPQTPHGNVHQVDHVPNGPTNSAAITTMLPLRLCGGKLLVAVTQERRYGPSRLRVNDERRRLVGPRIHVLGGVGFPTERGTFGGHICTRSDLPAVDILNFIR